MIKKKKKKKNIFNKDFVHLAIEGSLEEIKSTYGDGGINTSVLMIKVMGVFKGTDAIQNKIIKIDFAANLKRLVIWLLKPPYSHIFTVIGSLSMKRFAQHGRYNCDVTSVRKLTCIEHCRDVSDLLWLQFLLF